MVGSTGQKHPIVSLEVFTACGYNTGQIQTLPPGLVNAIPPGSPIQVPGSCAAFRQAPWKLPVAAGTLVKSPADATVYLVTRVGMKMPIASMQVLAGCGFTPQSIQTVPPQVIGGIPNGPALVNPQTCAQQRNQ
jgi:hypothetical protein